MGVAQATFTVDGAQGGDSNIAAGGLGGQVVGSLGSLTSGEQLTIYVGGAGSGITGLGGTNGSGSSSGGSGSFGAGGGAASGVTNPGGSFELIAGGGGGAGYTGLTSTTGAAGENGGASGNIPPSTPAAGSGGPGSDLTDGTTQLGGGGGGGTTTAGGSGGSGGQVIFSGKCTDHSHSGGLSGAHAGTAGISATGSNGASAPQFAAGGGGGGYWGGGSGGGGANDVCTDFAGHGGGVVPVTLPVRPRRRMPRACGQGTVRLWCSTPTQSPSLRTTTPQRKTPR